MTGNTKRLTSAQIAKMCVDEYLSNGGDDLNYLRLVIEGAIDADRSESENVKRSVQRVGGIDVQRRRTG